MIENVLPLERAPKHMSGAWVLLLGGVSTEGNRRARRLAREAAQRGLSVLWFDGFEETATDGSQRIPLEGGDRVAGAVTVVGYRHREADLTINRIANGTKGDGALPITIRTASEPGRGRRPTAMATRLARSLHRVWLRFHTRVVRRLATAMRGYAGWRLIRPQVLQLSAGMPPQRIVYCDDFSLTAAWHAARLWPDPPTGMGLGNP